LVPNLSRQKFVVNYVQALIERGNVQSQEVAKALNPAVLDASNQRRIERFLAQVQFESQAVLLMMILFLPKGKLHLSLDRTEWDFGTQQWNVLMLTACSEGVGLPLWWCLLDNNSGNSNTQERIQLLGQVVSLLGAERIGSLCADREFIGKEWYKWLLENKIRFFLRLPKSHRIQVGKHLMKPESILGNRQKALLDNIKVAGFSLSVALERVVNQRGEADLLVVLTNSFAYCGTRFYKQRWSIESFFESVKSRGFQLERTHLNKAERFETLLVLVCLAFSLCQRVGLLAHAQGHPIAVKKHGYKTHSFFRHGKNLIGEAWRKSGLLIEQWASFLYTRLLRQLLKLQKLTLFVG
jgi:Transposase DDE domain